MPATANFCAPVAAQNVTDYWDAVRGHPNAIDVNAGIPLGATLPPDISEYISWMKIE